MLSLAKMAKTPLNSVNRNGKIMNRRDFLQAGAIGAAQLVGGMAVAAPLDQKQTASETARIKSFELEDFCATRRFPLIVVPEYQAAPQVLH